LEPLNQDFPAEGHVTYVLKERTIFWLHAVNDRGGHSVPLVVEPLPREEPVQTAVAAEGPEVRSAPPDGAWIQFVALEKVDQLPSLRKSLERITGSELAVFEVQAPGTTERVLHRLRMGPFHTVREARTRLRQLQPKLRRLHLKPIVTTE
jgi:cell division septation protein DedD